MPRLTALLCCVLLLCCVFPLSAQDESEGTDVLPGTRLTGTLDDENPRFVSFFEGSRGEILRVNVTVQSGNLDPVVSLFDDTGNVIFTRDDGDDSQVIDTTLTIQTTGRHYLVIGRFGYEQGVTKGDFELTLERVGVISEQGTNLIYDVPIINAITSTQPQVYYTFQADAGSIINIDMSRSSGTLDPYLQVVDRNRFVIAENDDAPGGTRNARIQNLVLREAGTYIVVATRYGQAAGDSAGNFVLMVSESEGSGLGNSDLVPLAITYGQKVDETIDDEQYQRFYVFDAERDDLITATMRRTKGQIDAYLILADSNLQPIAENDDSGGGTNARLDRIRIPATGRYYLVAQRVDGILGVGSGEFQLELTREGSAFENVNPAIPRLEYSDSYEDNISEADPDSLFAFWGNEGDIVTITMNRASGDLDPVLVLLDEQQNPVRSDDDSGGRQNARLTRITLPDSGIYYIRAARYSGTDPESNPNTAGAYSLTLTVQTQ
jgi:hypothetical protein